MPKEYSSGNFLDLREGHTLCSRRKPPRPAEFTPACRCGSSQIFKVDTRSFEGRKGCLSLGEVHTRVGGCRRKGEERVQAEKGRRWGRCH